MTAYDLGFWQTYGPLIVLAGLTLTILAVVFVIARGAAAGQEKQALSIATQFNDNSPGYREKHADEKRKSITNYLDKARQSHSFKRVPVVLALALIASFGGRFLLGMMPLGDVAQVLLQLVLVVMVVVVASVVLRRRDAAHAVLMQEKTKLDDPRGPEVAA